MAESKVKIKGRRKEEIKRDNLPQSDESLVPEPISKKANYIFIALYILAIVLLFLLFRPYFPYLILGTIVVIFFFPLNFFLRKFIKSKMIVSTIMTIIVLLFILIPSIYMGYTISVEAKGAYDSMISADYTELSTQLSNLLGVKVNLSDFIGPVSSFFVNYMSSAIPSFLNSISDLLIKLFIMFFLIYYAFKEGDTLLAGFMDVLPITKSHKKQLLDETNKVLYGVLHGQFLVALIQGTIAGIGFWIFGFPNPIFWGFIMTILAFIPVLGTPLVWLPACLIQYASGNKFGAIGMFILGAVVVVNIDNIIKPKIIGDKTGLHPLLVILGIFGGIQLFGIIGMVVGPVLVALCILIIKFFNQDVVFN